MLASRNAHRFVEFAINQAGPTVVPHLITALANPKFARKYYSLGVEACSLLPVDGTPLEIVLECLEQYRPREAVAPVGPLLFSEDKRVRQAAALLLGSMAYDECAQPLQTAFSDCDKSVRSWAIIGIRRGLDEGRLSDTLRKAIYPAVRAMVPEDESAAECLLRLDRKRAIDDLSAPELLRVGTSGFAGVLTALRAAGVHLDEAQLTSLADELEQSEMDYPNDKALGEVLQLLSLIRSQEAEERIRRGLKSRSKRVREGAAKAQNILKGTATPFAIAFDLLKDVGWTGLTTPQQRVLAVRMLIDEVNNGGFSQYFSNSSGEYWRMALEGLRCIGAARDAGILAEVVKAFGPNGAAATQEEREEQFMQLSEEEQSETNVQWGRLGKQFYKNEDDREVLLLQYIGENAEHFRRPG